MTFRVRERRLLGMSQRENVCFNVRLCMYSYSLTSNGCYCWSLREVTGREPQWIISSQSYLLPFRLRNFERRDAMSPGLADIPFISCALFPSSLCYSSDHRGQSAEKMKVFLWICNHQPSLFESEGVRTHARAHKHTPKPIQREGEGGFWLTHWSSTSNVGRSSNGESGNSWRVQTAACSFRNEPLNGCGLHAWKNRCLAIPSFFSFFLLNRK